MDTNRAEIVELFDLVASGEITAEYLDRALAKGVNLNGRDHPDVRLTPLELAVTSAKPESVKVLIAAGADVLARCRDGSSLLRAASNGGHPCIPVLLAAGADIHERDDKGWTVLMWAAASGDRNAVKVLLDHGADPAARATDGRCAAELCESAEIVALLTRSLGIRP